MEIVLVPQNEVAGDGEEAEDDVGDQDEDFVEGDYRG